jgi:hypothetical protein
MVYHHLEPASHADAWLAATFPHRKDVIGEMLSRLGVPSPIEDDLPDKSFFGRVVECALGLTLAARPADLRLLGCLPPDQARGVLSLAEFVPPPSVPAAAPGQWQPSGRMPHSARLFSAASRLAVVDVRLRQFGLRRVDIADVALGHFERHPHDLVHPDAEPMWPVFHSLWTTHIHGFHTALRSYGTATVQVPLLGGRHHADFLLGATLLEVKAGRLDRSGYVNALIDQLLRYTLLALHDDRKVSHVAVYATRHRRLLRYPVTDFLYQLHGGPFDLSMAGTHLAHRIELDQPQLPPGPKSQAA